MPFIAILKDPSAHGSVVVTPGVNSKISYNGILFTTQIGQTAVHVPPHLVPLPGIIIDPKQSKIFFNNIPFAVLGATCTCGDIVVGNPKEPNNPKVSIS